MKERKTIRISCHRRADSSPILRLHLRAALALPIACAFAFGIGVPCRADLVIEAPIVTAAPGTSGSFDVLITSTGGTFSVASDIVELSLNGLSGVSFTGVSIATATPYIYGGNSATTQGSTFSFSTFPAPSGTPIEVFDFLYPSGAQTIAPGDTFGLVNVQYSVDANVTPGSTGTLTFGSDTSLADAGGNNVSFTGQGGSITIVTASVPEPASGILLAIGCAAVAFRFASRRPASTIG